MKEKNVLKTLRTKKAEIERVIDQHEAQLKRARNDLAHIAAVIYIYEVNGEPSEFPAYVDFGPLFRRGEMMNICKAALASEGPLDTRELALRVIEAKGLSANDAPLKTTIAQRVTQAMTQQSKRGGIRKLPRRGGVNVWEIEAGYAARLISKMESLA